MDLSGTVRARLGDLVEREKTRLLRAGGTDQGRAPRLQQWEIIRVIQGYEEEHDLRSWLHMATPEEVRPIVCGYDDLLIALDRDEERALEEAGRIATSPLSEACAILCRRGMRRLDGVGRLGRSDPLPAFDVPT
jgi:hypothetical protein